MPDGRAKGARLTAAERLVRVALAERFKAGADVAVLAAEAGVSRPALSMWLRRNGLRRPGNTAWSRLRVAHPMANRTAPEDAARFMAAVRHHGSAEAFVTALVDDWFAKGDGG